MLRTAHFGISRPVLLSAAQFAAFPLGLLFSTQFPKSSYVAQGVGTHGTFQKSCFLGCYRRHNLIFPQKSCRRIFAKKYFFALLHPAHGYFRHSFVVIPGAIGLERTAHFCCNIRHSYTYFLNIYKYLIKISKRKNADFGRRKRNVSSVTIIDTCNTICYYTLIVL